MVKKLNSKKCRGCKGSFVPRNSLQVCCDLMCAIEYDEIKKDKKLAGDIKQAEKIKRADIRERKEKLKNRNDWIKDLQKVFNEFIRWRDYGNKCISCDKFEYELKINHSIAMVCGHYLSVGANPELRFTENNAHLQCTRCNGGAGKYGKFNGKGLTVTKLYRINLINKIGHDEVDKLEGPHKPLKLDIYQIKQLIIDYRLKIKLLKDKNNDDFI